MYFVENYTCEIFIRLIYILKLQTDVPNEIELIENVAKLM